MKRTSCLHLFRGWLPLFVLVALSAPALAAPTTRPPDGLRDNTPQVHAMVGARIVVAPGEVIERGTLVIRDGVIEAVGPDVKPPADARVLNVQGKTLYPGLFDAYAQLSAARKTDEDDEHEDHRHAAKPQKSSEVGHWNPRVRPETRAERRYSAGDETNQKLRAQGITTRLIVPSQGIVRGASAVVTTGDDPPASAVVKAPIALHVQLTVPRGESRDIYPNSPMGAVALVRQTFYEVDWYRRAWRVADKVPSAGRPEHNESLGALQSLLDAGLPVVFDAPDELYFLRADRVRQEFDLPAIVRGSGREYRRLDAVRRTGLPVLVPVNFPKPPDVRTPEAARSVSLERLLHWDLAPENPARLAGAGVEMAFTSWGLDEPKEFLPGIRKAVYRGLSPEAALRALTVAPAELYGLADRLGTLETGKAANLIVTDGDLFSEETGILETWVDGRRHVVRDNDASGLAGIWALRLEDNGRPESLELRLVEKEGKLSGRIVRGDEEADLSHVSLDASRLAAGFDAKLVGGQGVVRLSAVISDTETVPDEWRGTLAWSEGGTSSFQAKRGEKTADAAEPKEEKEKPQTPRDAAFDVSFPLGAFGRTAPPEEHKAVFFRDATVWTCGPKGTLQRASVLVRDGKITELGTDLQPPDGALVVDCAGKHLTPGIVDCHSHIATDGGVNESAQAVTAEVRIGDFIDSNDINIYRQLAGGVTSSNILHGSANPIGGQNQVVKFRWGALPKEMKFTRAPEGIKFALGENVKQSNWGDKYTTRYPQTRMGVQQIVRDEFAAARDYRRRWDQWKKDKSGLPPRTDLELEAVAEILEGTRLIHCHAYRQDEMLALMRTCEDFGVTIGTFQHVLEGYKIADAMARHGVMGSAFADWWAYKFEVYDAIPYNGALMHRAGVVVSYNSDSAELARRLNLEAAKATKYGAIEPEEAFRFVSLNAATQLGIDRYVGSIEPGKDADLVVWSGPPMSGYSVCHETWVDGRKYFDREDDHRLRARRQKMRARLIQRVLVSGEEPAGPGEEPLTERDLWPREDLFCGHHDHGHHHGHHHEVQK